MLEKRIKLKNGIILNTRFTQSLGNKPIILLIHFSGGTSFMWEGVIPILEKSYSIIAPDLRGHGKSDKPQTGYHIDDMGEDLYQLLEELNISNCHIVGSSLGAEVGISLAASHPEMVTSIVCEGAIYNEFGGFGLFNGTYEEINEEKKNRNFDLAERKLKKYKSEQQFIEDFKGSIEELGIWNEYFYSFYKSCIELTSDGDYEYFYKNYIRTEYIQKYWDVSFEEYYKKVKCPVLFMPSEEEWNNPMIQHSLNHFVSYLESYKIVTIKEALHAYVWLQFPQLATSKVIDFLSENNK